MSAAVSPPELDATPREVEAVTPLVRSAAGEPILPVAFARAVAFLALAAWGALHWMSMLEPSEPGRGWTVTFVAGLAVAAMLAAGRLAGRRRTLAAVGALVPVLALVFVAGRVADELLLPGGWSALAGGISRGISDLPGVRVPYRGLDEWVRTVIPLGGSALAVLAAVLAFWPRRQKLGFPVAALLVLVALYVVPVVALDFTAEFLRGAVFTLLMVAFLRLERLRRPDTAAAVGLALLATFVALVAAPLLNRDTPWFDYETWALETSSSKSTTFTWDHSYDGLNWPRDGRELLRVQAKQAAYWKAENLNVFDGEHWLRSRLMEFAPELPANRQLVQRWSQNIRVSIRNLRTDNFVTAGYAEDVTIPRIEDTPTLDGLYVSSRTLRRGDTYTALVYTPRPSESQRRRAGTAYDSDLRVYTTLYTTTLGLAGAPRNQVTFPFFGSDPEQIELGRPLDTTPERELARNKLTRTYALARRLMQDSRTPEDYVQAVLRLLGDTAVYTYSETPPRTARTLDGFLFDAKTGYCQQYSGAMALLLRMAGIPARVVTGFSTGATDTKTGEYVVRDFDAHSWVEVFYPGWGWLTFDPTPAASPARSQPADAAAGNSTGGSGSAPNFARDIAAERGAGIAVAGESTPWWTWALRVMAVLAALWLAFLGVRRWRRGAPPALSELERALRRARRVPAPGTTLHALERHFSATPAAAGYVRALRESRYADTPSHPTRAQRRGLRSELGRGGGLLGHLRAWWALPPR